MKKLVALLFVVFIANNISAQNEKIDSVENLLNTTQIDTIKVQALTKLCWLYRPMDAPKAIEFGLKAIKLSKEINYSKGISSASSNLGVAYRDRGEIELAKESHQLSLTIDKRIKNYSGIASSYNNLAIIADDEGDYDEAIRLVLKSVEAYETVNDAKGIGGNYNTLGNIYVSQENFDKAEEYYLLAKDQYQKEGDQTAVATAFMNLGIVYFYKGLPDTTMLYFNKTLEVYMEMDHKIGQSNILGNIAKLHLAKGENEKALAHYNRAITIIKEVGDKGRLSNLYLNIAAVYSNGYEDDIKTLEYLHKGLDVSVSANSFNNTKRIYESLANAYKNNGDYKKAYEYKDLYIILNDSLFNEKKLKQIGELEAKYQNEKIILENENLEFEKALQTEEIENERNQKYLLYGGLAIVLLFMAVLFLNFQRKKRDNVLIRAQKEEVENQKVEIEHQHHVLEEQHQEITDSINYAKRIQSALLTEDTEWDKISKDHFVLFKPKDVVSGDFFWAYHNKQQNLSIWVAADCTGHGVPGAFMSMLGIGFLNEIIVESGLTNTAEILNQLREKIIKALEQKNVDTQQKDGMDLAICIWDKNKNILEYSGANNPLWLLRDFKHISDEQMEDSKTTVNEDQTRAIVEYRANKMPVGLYAENLESFTSVIIPLHKDDIIYTFSDGFADQFGGEKGKKFKYKPFKHLLLDNQACLLVDQKETLLTQFEDWRGALEQIDDVVVIGIKV